MSTSEPAHSLQEIQRLKCAFLASQGMKQADIARTLGPNVGQPTVSKYLKEARQLSLLQQRVVWPGDFPQSDRSAIEQSVLPPEDRQRLMQLLDSWRPDGLSPAVRDLHVVYAGGDDETEVFGRNAAPQIAQMLKSTGTCAVAWGETIKAIVNAIGPYATAQTDQLQFIPLCGQPLNHHTDRAITSSAAALKLGELYDTAESGRYSLRGVPAQGAEGDR